MIQLNYIYFTIITYMGFRFLSRKEGLLRNPLDKSQLMICTGPELFWILTFSTGLLAFSAPGALDLMAVRLLVLEVFCIGGLFISKNKPVWNLATLCYLFYLLWLVIGLSYTPSKMYGIRVILKYIYPFLIMLFASAVVRDKEIFLKAGIGVRTVAIVSLVISFVPFIGRLLPGVFWYGTARTIHYISITIFSLALYHYTKEKKKNLVLTILFMLPCIIWLFRTSIMGTTLAIMTFYFFKYKFKSLPAIAGIIILFLAIIFLVPSVKDKMFFKAEGKSIYELREGNISMGDINSNGRFGMWDTLLSKFYQNRELLGSGTGCTQNYYYSNFVFGGLKVAHNDYVQILCDNGLIGILLYLFTIISVIIHCFVQFNNSQNCIFIKICAIIAGSSMAGIGLTMYTDNVVNYSMATLSYPFGFYGMMLGLTKRKNHNKYSLPIS